ncbi:hypothetical protein SLA2020_425210 [Shorea laevis]
MRSNDDFRMLVRRTRVRGPMSGVRKELEALVTKLKNIVRNKRRTRASTTTPMPLTLRNKAETLFWKRHEEILGDDDTEEEHPRYSNFSFDEGSGWHQRKNWILKNIRTYTMIRMKMRSSISQRTY